MIEPALQPVPEKDSMKSMMNTSEGARLDIGVSGFWRGRFERCFLDVRVLNLHAPSNSSKKIDARMRRKKDVREKSLHSSNLFSHQWNGK